LIIIISYLPWIILDSWKSNTSVNYFIWLALLDSRSQFLSSHAIFNRRAYTTQVDWIISCKSSSFFICDVTSQGTFPMPQALRPNTCNSSSEVNLTKVSFENGEHCFAIVTSLSHLRCDLAQVQLVTFWSFRLYTAMTFPKMRTFILAWSWCRRFLLEVDGLSCLAFSTTKSCTSFKCLVNNHLAQYATMQVPTLHFRFNPPFVHYLPFRTKLGGQRGAGGWEA